MAALRAVARLRAPSDISRPRRRRHSHSKCLHPVARTAGNGVSGAGVAGDHSSSLEIEANLIESYVWQSIISCLVGDCIIRKTLFRGV
jgi:hypothetical protein